MDWLPEKAHRVLCRGLGSLSHCGQCAALGLGWLKMQKKQGLVLLTPNSRWFTHSKQDRVRESMRASSLMADRSRQHVPG